jgi:hypothetical protein
MSTPALDVDEIVVISLRESAERQAAMKAQFPAGVRWRFHEVERDPEGGRAGCYRSHAEVLEQARRRGLRRVLVLEDDALLVADWAETARLGNAALATLEETDAAWSFLLLGMHPIDSGPAEGPLRRVACAAGTHAYVANIKNIELPLPPYDGKHIDHFLFCDYFCQGMPENMHRERWGENANAISLLTHRATEPCLESGKHIYAANPLLFRPDTTQVSTIDRMHELGPWFMNDVIGVENSVAVSVFGTDRLGALLLLALFAATVAAGAAVGRKWPSREPAAVFASLLLLLPFVAEAPSVIEQPTPCSFPCTYLRRWQILPLVALIAAYCGAVAYAVASRVGRLPPLAAVAVVLLGVGWFGIVATVGFSASHYTFAAVGFFSLLACGSYFMTRPQLLALLLVVTFGPFEGIRSIFVAGEEKARLGRELTEQEECDLARPYISRVVRSVLFAFVLGAVFTVYNAEPTKTPVIVSDYSKL